MWIERRFPEVSNTATSSFFLRVWMWSVDISDHAPLGAELATADGLYDSTPPRKRCFDQLPLPMRSRVSDRQEGCLSMRVSVSGPSKRKQMYIVA